ncbi:capsid maturation protease [Arthrobacter phage Shambre1]|uniref:Capsid maturation protease n=1 Tax=Arthrobacter phage Shambre1 TaxID=2927284 RepID=A0A977KNK2_9CAUD|nr:capsid maturation protease [Arthrobacter phage Shambre1]UXE04743.1 capsid maturation protease [Arthrobacter phage Shambre1]
MKPEITISKTFLAKATASADPEKRGQFEAIVSAFGNKDSQGDVIEAGAFTKTLAEWIVKGRPIPVVWSHQFSDPESILGQYISAEETDEGLKMVGQLELNWAKAARVHELMEKGLIVEFSISGKVRDYELIEDDDEDSWWPSMKIKDIDLWEAGPCFKGANPDTELLSVKSDGRLTGSAPTALKAGRVLAQKHVDSLKDVRDQIDTIISAVDTTDDGDNSAKTAAPNVTLAETEPGDQVKANPYLTKRVRAALELLQ